MAAAGIGLSRFSGVARSVLVTNILGIGLIGDAFAAALARSKLLQICLGKDRSLQLSYPNTADFLSPIQRKRESWPEVSSPFSCVW